jgi:hypothetical protein
MRTVKASISRRGWRALLVAAALILGVALFVGCGTSGSGSAQGDSGGGYSAPPAATDDGATAGNAAAGSAGGSGGAETASEQTLDVWANDGCLEYLVLDSANDTVAVSATNLCRTTAVSSFNGSAYAGPGTYYAYFARGASPDNWQAVVGQGDDGNNYWEYSDGPLYRQPESGGPAQLLVQQPDGEITFEDETTYLQANPQGLPFLQSVKEGIAAQAIANELAGGPLQRNPQLPGSASTEYSQAQDGVTTADQQAKEYGQTYKDATQGGISASQELVEETQAAENFNKIAYSSDCSESDNVESGCGGASAFNDDGGVGEGDG